MRRQWSTDVLREFGGNVTLIGNNNNNNTSSTVCLVNCKKPPTLTTVALTILAFTINMHVHLFSWYYGRKLGSAHAWGAYCKLSFHIIYVFIIIPTNNFRNCSFIKVEIILHRTAGPRVLLSEALAIEFFNRLELETWNYCKVDRKYKWSEEV